MEKEQQESEEYYFTFTPPAQQKLSPKAKAGHQKLFSSPFEAGKSSDMRQRDDSNRNLLIDFSDSFNRSMLKQQKKPEQGEQILDIMGNPIHQFTSSIDRQEPSFINLPKDEDEDKENATHCSTQINTPLKIKRTEIRSPLGDLTPTMSQKKKKTHSKLTISEKSRLLDPRTIEKNLFATSGFRY